MKKNEELSTKMKQMEEEKTKLNGEVLKAQNTLKQSIIRQNSIGKEPFIKNLDDFIKVKDNTIKELKNEKEKLMKENEQLKQKNQQIKLGNPIEVIINSADQKIKNCKIKSYENELFDDVEKKIYGIFSEYKEINNNFMIGDRQVLRFKTMSENNIKNNDKIILIKK